jgi:hypothetical protein
MRHIDHLLRDRERVLIVTREHGVVLVRPFLRAALVVGAASAMAVALAGARWMWPAPALLAAAAGLAALRAVARLALQVGRWHTRRLVVTDRKVMYVRGALRRRVSALSLAAVDDVEVARRSRLLGISCGGLVVYAGGRHGTLFGLRRLPHPDRLLSLLVSLIDDEREPRAAAWADEQHAAAPTAPSLASR